MINKPSSTPGPQSANALAAPGPRAIGARPCPNCGARVNVNATVCPACGEGLPALNRKIRCRHCHQPAAASLVVCPHCGRNLVPARSRWITWGLPALLVVLLLLLALMRVGRSNPLEWSKSRVERAIALVNGLGSRFKLDVTVVTVPAGEDASDPLVSQAIQASNNPGALRGSGEASPGSLRSPAGPPPPGAPGAAALVPAQIAAADTATAAPPTTAPTALPSPTAPPSPTAANSTPTATGTPSALLKAATGLTGSAVLTKALSTVSASGSMELATPTPAATATPAATPTPAQTYVVRRGDTLSDVATRFDVAVDDLLAANNLSEQDVFAIQPGQTLVIPAVTDTPTPTPTPAGGPLKYTIRAGDTIYTIAERLKVSADDLLAVNKMNLVDARSLQPGDELIVPGDQGLPTATPTPAPTTAPTTTPTTAPAATAASLNLLLPTATPTTAMGRLDAPLVRAPADGVSLRCKDANTLSWQPVSGLGADNLYVVHLGFVTQDGSNQDQVMWVLASQQPSSASSMALDGKLCALAPASGSHEWRWYVEVAQKTATGTQAVSAPSQTRRFTWQ